MLAQIENWYSNMMRYGTHSSFMRKKGFDFKKIFRL